MTRTVSGFAAGRKLTSSGCGGEEGALGAAGDIIDFFVGDNNEACKKLNEATGLSPSPFPASPPLQTPAPIAAEPPAAGADGVVHTRTCVRLLASISRLML